MTTPPRRRYRVRLRTALAGSILAAASATSLLGVGTAPALASTARVTVESPEHVDEVPGDRVARGEVASSVGPASTGSTSLATIGRTSDDRLAGVEADLDRAVLLRLVTPEQASGFYAQMERRVAAGL